MNAFAVYYVNEHLQSLREQSSRPVHKVERPSLRGRIGTAVADLRRSVTSTTDPSNALIPTLKDYPYRS